MSQPYEIELVRSESDNEDHRQAIFATLTGLSKEEITQRWPKHLFAKSWGGQRFVEAARALGFSTTLRFTKFEEKVIYPCVIRVQIPESWGWGKGNWWALVYNQGKIYNVNEADSWHICTLQEFLMGYNNCYITSMLQVWMSTNTSLATKF